MARKDAATVLALAAELPAYMEAQRQRPGGVADLNMGPLELDGLRRQLDLAAAQILGEDQRPGSAAKLRLHAETQYGLAAATVDHMRSNTLASAAAVTFAKQGAEAMTSALSAAA